jgi:hypothetical protein
MTCPYCDDTGWVDSSVTSQRVPGQAEIAKSPCQCRKYRSLGGHLRSFFNQPQQQQSSRSAASKSKQQG